MKRIPSEGLNAAQLAAIAAYLKDAAALPIEKLREAAATELYAVIDLVRRALTLALYPLQPTAWVDVYAIYPDRVIVRDGGRLFSLAYSIDATNQVTVGAKSEVVEDYVPVSMKEAAEANVFLESVNEEGSIWEVTVIRSGLSKNGFFYPDAVLREAVPLFEGARVFVKGDAEHLKGGGKDVRNIAGWLSDAKFIEGKGSDHGRVTAKLHLSKAVENVRTLIADAWKRGKRDLVGLSIDAEGTAKTAMREGVKVRQAQKITKVSSVDLIVEASAGGQLIRMIEAFNQDEDQDMKLRIQMLEAIKSKAPAAYAKIDPEKISDEDLLTAYREALAAPEVKPAQQQQAEKPAATVEQVNDAVRMVEARGSARSAIADSRLPQPAKERLFQTFATRERFTEADVAAAIKGEREYLAKMTESGRVTLDLGEGDVSVEDRKKKIDTMLDTFFDRSKPAISFKEAYIEITGDRRVTGRLEDCDKTRLAEAVGTAFRESLDSTSFANVLGNSITRRMVAEYRNDNRYNAWRPLVNTVPVNDFRTQERTRFGGYGDLPAVAEGGAYDPLTSPTDEKATYGVTKRGGTENVTIEMIKNDDVGAIRMIPVKLGRSAARTLGKFVFDFYRTNPTVYDSIAFFHASHNNLASTALSAAELAIHRLLMLKQSELSSADRIGIGPKFLIVPWDLQQTAVDLFNRNTNLDKTFVQDMSLTIVPAWYWTDTNDWLTAADPSDIDGIEIGFLDGREDPEIFVQDNPSVGSLFSHDQITWKIRHVYGGNVKDFRCATKAVV